MVLRYLKKYHRGYTHTNRTNNLKSSTIMANFGIISLSENVIKYNFLPIGKYEKKNGRFIATFNYGSFHYQKSAKCLSYLKTMVATCLNIITH
jgi:hypothetical protein